MSEMTEITQWAWNGYDAQWLEDNRSREEIIREMLNARSAYDLESIVILQDDEHAFTVEILERYDFYGWRWKRRILTTATGVYEEDEEYDNIGYWVFPESVRIPPLAEGC
ncbi:MAG: hypothetical protein MN733_31635 [Nitrososphaera sp.]|nr:hypothetical protein [Nitrososphaera sp.]